MYEGSAERQQKGHHVLQSGVPILWQNRKPGWEPLLHWKVGSDRQYSLGAWLVIVRFGEVLMRAGLGFVWGSFGLDKGLISRMLLGSFNVDFGSVWVG